MIRPGTLWKPLLLLPLLVLLRWTFIEQLDALAFDFSLRLRGVQTPDNRIEIVAIDDGSLQAIGPWPWSRPTQEKLFNAIFDAKPALLGVDILIPLLAEYPRLRSSDRVVLATAVGMTRSGSSSFLAWQEPSDWRESLGPTLGHIHADKDLDGVCRSIPLSIAEMGQRRWALSIELARLYWGVDSEQLRFRGNRLLIGQHSVPRLDHPIDESVDSRGVLTSLQGDHLLINSRGGPRTFSYLSAADLINGQAELSERLRDKIVLLGATSYSLGDHLSTAFSGPSEMPGVEIHANALDTILNERFLHTTTESQTLLLMAIAMVATWLLMRTIPAGPLVPFLSTLVGVVSLCLLSFLVAGLWVPLASLVISVVSAAGLAQFSRYAERESPDGSLLHLPRQQSIRRTALRLYRLPSGRLRGSD